MSKEDLRKVITLMPSFSANATCTPENIEEAKKKINEILVNTLDVDPFRNPFATLEAPIDTEEAFGLWEKMVESEVFEYQELFKLKIHCKDIEKLTAAEGRELVTPEQFKKTTQYLKKYRLLKTIIENKSRKINAIKDEIILSVEPKYRQISESIQLGTTVSRGTEYTDSVAEIASRIENNEQINRLKKEIKEDEELLYRLGNGLKVLKDIEYKVIKLRYMDGKSWVKTEMEIQIRTRATLFKNHDDAVTKIAITLFCT